MQPWLTESIIIYSKDTFLKTVTYLRWFEETTTCLSLNFIGYNMPKTFVPNNSQMHLIRKLKKSSPKKLFD